MLTQKEIIEVAEFRKSFDRANAETNLGKACMELVSEDDNRDEGCIYVKVFEHPETGEKEAIIE